jgi:hypothetical protein
MPVGSVYYRKFKRRIPWAILVLVQTGSFAPHQRACDLQTRSALVTSTTANYNTAAYRATRIRDAHFADVMHLLAAPSTSGAVSLNAPCEIGPLASGNRIFMHGTRVTCFLLLPDPDCLRGAVHEACAVGKKRRCMWEGGYRVWDLQVPSTGDSSV